MLPVAILAACRKLATIDAWDTQATSAEMERLATSKVRALSIGASAVEAAVGLLPLRSLRFAAKKPWSLELAARIAACRSLEELTVAGATMTGEALRALLTLPKLRALSLCELEHDAVLALVQHPGRLEELSPGWLRDDEKIRPETMQALVSRPGLVRLGLSVPLTATVVDAIRASPTLRHVAVDGGVQRRVSARLREAGWRYNGWAEVIERDV